MGEEVIATEKRCSGCGDTKPRDCFGVRSDGRNLRSRCRSCETAALRDYTKREPDKWRETQRRKDLKLKYGITPERYDEILIEQAGVCAICGTENPGAKRRYFCVDHDHDCCPETPSCGRCVRGLLCNRCNKALGLFDDNPDLLLDAAEYLGYHIGHRPWWAR